MLIGKLPYIVTGVSIEEEGQALAAAGVLQAAGLAIRSGQMDQGELHARLVSLLAGKADASLAWRPLQSGGEVMGTDAVLAAAWRDAFAEAGNRRPARLLIEADAATNSAELTELLRRLQAPLLAQRGAYPDWQNLGAGVVAGFSVLFPTRQRARYIRRHKWSWPLRTKLSLGVHGYGVERGFVVDEPFGPLDVELASFLPARGLERGGVRLILDSFLDPGEAVWRRLTGGTIGRRPEALVPLDRVALPELLTSLSYEVAHDAPIDFALSLAWLRHERGGLAPVFLVPPGGDWPAELEATRLRRRIAELIAQLRRLRRRDILYVDEPLRAFGLYGEIGPSDPRELADRLEHALQSETVRYDRESDVATDLLTLGRALAQARVQLRADVLPRVVDQYSDFAADAVIDNDARDAFERSELQQDYAQFEPFEGAEAAKPTPLGEAKRYTDLLLYRGFHHGTASPVGVPVLAEDEALQPRSSYTLEVAIRRDPIGIAATGAERPVQAPPGRTDPGVLAVVSCRQANAPMFQDRLLAITWPHDADSTAALFRIQTGAALPPEPLSLEIRLYTRAGLQLLDLLELRFAEERWAKHQPETGHLTAPAAAPSEDAVSFHVAAKPGGYDFEVVFTRDGEAHLDAPLGRLVSDADLEMLLSRMRSFWTRLVIGKLSARAQLSAQGYKEELGQIVELGGAAWRTLFGDRRGAQSGTPEALGETLRRHPLPFGAPVRVTLASDADAFVFPWAILCPPLRREEVPDPEAIWGLRHRIELTRKYCEPYRRPAAAGKVRIATVLDPGFANSVDHEATLRRVATVGAGAELVPGLGTAQAVLDKLEAQPPAEIYYYFCHGFAPGRATVLARDLLLELRQEVERLEDAADQRLWQMLLDRLGEGSEVAAMFTGAARITEDDLRRAEFFAEGRPIIFLNMCHSADLLPSLRSGLTRVFIDRNAAAVLGTECPVTSIFADMFAERVLGALLRGVRIGTALLEARRYFHMERNPLGLLYTLYGHEDAQVAEATNVSEERAA